MKKPLLIHIPKTGGTSLVRAFCLPRWTRNHRKIGGVEMSAFMKKFSNTHPFAFLRDPLDRAVSAYYFFVWDKAQGAKPNITLNYTTSPAWVFSCMARIADMDVNSFYRGMLRDDALQYRRISNVIVHFRPQSHWVSLANRMTKDIAFYDFGKFSSEFNRLCDDLGYGEERPELKHLLKSPRRSSSWKDELAPDVVAMLRDFYREDYQLLDQQGIHYESDFIS